MISTCYTLPPYSVENGSTSTTSTSDPNRPTLEVGVTQNCNPPNPFQCLFPNVEFNIIPSVPLFHQNMDHHHQHLFTFPPGYGQFALGIFDDNFDLRAGLPTEDNRETEHWREREMASRQRYSARQPRGRHVPRRQGTRHEGVPTLEG